MLHEGRVCYKIDLCNRLQDIAPGALRGNRLKNAGELRAARRGLLLLCQPGRGFLDDELRLHNELPDGAGEKISHPRCAVADRETPVVGLLVAKTNRLQGFQVAGAMDEDDKTLLARFVAVVQQSQKLITIIETGCTHRSSLPHTWFQSILTLPASVFPDCLRLEMLEKLSRKYTSLTISPICPT